MIFSELPKSIAEKAMGHSVVKGLRRRPRVYTNTQDFTSIDYGDIIVVDGRYFLIIAYTKEGRFGVDDQPKQWVPKVTDLASGETYILKLVFHEKFEISLGDFQVTCYRNPEKEARVLELVSGNERFMQGYGVEDEGGNLVRVLDIVRGRRLDKYIHLFKGTHEEYFENVVPGLMTEFRESMKAISYIHANGLRHGDIRRDHVYVEYDTNMFRWIDFDYDFYLPERPFALDIFELGSILMYITAKGNFYPKDVVADPMMGKKIMDSLCQSDLSLLAKNRIVNLKKLFPYIPRRLNDIFMHFSLGTPVFYDSVDELISDFDDYLASC